MPPIILPIIAFIIVIGVLVFVHEMGHFLAARMTGMRADIFSIGMGPRLMGWNRKTGFTLGKLPEDIDLGPDTDYRLCWLPIGGYVRILGMIDESFDTEFAKKPVQPYEFRSKKNWQKAFVLSAGVIMNILFAVCVFAGLLLVNGTDLPRSTTVAWVEPNTAAHRANLTAGDSIESIDGIAVHNWGGVVDALARTTSGTRVIQVRRGTEHYVARITSDDIVKGLADQQGLGIDIAMSLVFGAISPGSPASRANVEAGDTVIAADGQPIHSVRQFQTIVRSNAGKSIVLALKRQDSILSSQVSVGPDSTIGVALGAAYIGPIDHKDYNLFEATGQGMKSVLGTVDLIWSTLKRVFRGVVAPDKALGGPLTIAMQAGQSFSAGAVPFLSFMALISVSLAFMNVLPLPGLDGGHLLIVAIESVLRRELSTKVKIRIQQVGVFLLLTLMAGILVMELRKIFFS